MQNKPFQAANILVVDDDQFTLTLLEEELEKNGFRVTLASDLESLLARVKEKSFDCVLVDLFLGEQSGLEAIPHLVRESPYTKIIVMSAHGTVELAVDALEKGATSFLCKSKEPRELVHLLKEKFVGEGARASKPQLPEETFGILGTSDSVRETLAKIHHIKDIDSTVIVSGESGTGKELVARAIHQSSKRSSQRFEAINCAAIPETLMESELFGHRRGAFTDARTDRKGLFEVCDGGTLFLDEIGEMPLPLQVKLLRVLQEREVTPIGASQSIKVDTRVVAATNRDLAAEVKRGAFRADLYYRLNVLNFHLAPLRNRRGDIVLLVEQFLKRFNQRFSKNVAPPSKDVEARLVAYEWPGNIRELQNAVERGVVLSTDGQLHLEHMLDAGAAASVESAGGVEAARSSHELWSSPLSEAKKQFEKAYLQHLLETTKGNVSEVARISGRYRTDIYRLMTKYGMESEEFRA
jgi:two-component system, NtrC family, response regulator GlrR